MLRESVKTGVSVFVLILLGVVTTGVAHAQSRRDCSAAGPTGIGFSMGRSLTPYSSFREVRSGRSRRARSILAEDFTSVVE
jgi:hypothetical protein